MKEDYDGAEPTASSVAVMNLLVLAHLTESSQWSEQIDRTLRLFGTRLEQMGRAVPMMAAALSTYLAGVQQIVLVGADADRAQLAHVVASRCVPFAVTIDISDRHRNTPGGDDAVYREPAVATQWRVRAYVCRNFTCEAPVREAAALKEMLA